MNEIIEFFKELILLKKDDDNAVGISGFKRRPSQHVQRQVRKDNKEFGLSNLMRRA